jgi:hypothetical protein
MGYSKKLDARIGLGRTFKMRDQIEMDVLNPDRKNPPPEWASLNRAG